MKKKAKIKGASGAPKRTRRWGNQFSKKYTDTEIERLGEEMVEWFGEKGESVTSNLWLKDFAISRMIGANRIGEFAEKNEYFASLLGICKDMQESKLVKLGMSKRVSGSMPIFALKNVAGWRDIQDLNMMGAVKVIRDNI